jgi:signal transduction histidine kinase
MAPLAPLAAVALVFALEEAFDLPAALTGIALVAGATIVAAMFLRGVRDLRAADARTAAAHELAAAAEAIQRERADEMARVLRASESLVLTGEGRVDYMGVLSLIAPAGCTSFLARIDIEDEVNVVAAHGPMAASLIGYRGAASGLGLDPDGQASVSFSGSGRQVGIASPQSHVTGLEAGVQAALAIRLADHDGRRIGSLHMLDPVAERVLDPTFVGLAQLVANQIAVAMENDALTARLRQELAANRRVGQQLLQATKLVAVGELASAVAHEVNNPLTGILGFSELLLTEIEPGDPRREEVDVIRVEAVRARTIIKALLEFARPRTPQRIPVFINDLAKSTLDLVRFKADELGISIVESYSDAPSLELDPDAVKQVLLSLINNAITAMPDGGTLQLATAQVGERIRLAVADTGIGMDEETRSHIFAPFFSNRLAVGDDSGLGLSVSRQIIESHGGTIEVESTPRHGAVFTVWLPLDLSSFEGTTLVPGVVLGRPSASHSADDGSARSGAQDSASRGISSQANAA